MGVAVFDYSVWAVRYPELAVTVAEPLAALLFQDAGLYLNNTDCSPVTNVARRTQLLNMLTAHLAYLENQAKAGGGVGRISNASQGSVSIAFDMGDVSAAKAFYAQTPYGLMYWQATQGYRTAHYVPGPPSRARAGAFPYAGGVFRQPGQW